MKIPNDFSGLGMPVFTAFGWASEEAAIKYAYTQLEAFISIIHSNLSKTLRDELPHFGYNVENQNVFLAASEDIDSDVHILFNARPTSLEIQLALTDKAALSKGWKYIEKDLEGFRQYITALDPTWALRIQQIHLNEDTGDMGHYQDVYKDSVQALGPEIGVEAFQKSLYLNSDDKWVTPFYLSQRTSAEQIAAMQKKVIDVVVERLTALTPIILNLKGRSAKRVAKSAAPKKAKKKKAKVQKDGSPVQTKAQKPPTDNSFTYITELKPLHLRRGFLNMETMHWPFFARNARTESREVTVVTNTMRDDQCSVWRLQPNNMARLVLTPKAHTWLENHFAADDMIQLTATKGDNGNIEILIEDAE